MITTRFAPSLWGVMGVDDEGMVCGEPKGSNAASFPCSRFFLFAGSWLPFLLHTIVTFTGSPIVFFMRNACIPYQLFFRTITYYKAGSLVASSRHGGKVAK